MRITISRTTWQMLMRATRAQPEYEVGGFARINVQDSEVIVDDILIPPQEVGAAHVDIAAEDLGWLAVRLAERQETPRTWCLWWHSHARMGTNPSPTDYATLRMLAEQAQWGYYLGLVVNVRGETTAWACYQSPLVASAYHDALLQVHVDEPVDPEIAAYIDAQLQHVHVAKPAWTALPPKSSKSSKPSTLSKSSKRNEWAELLGLDDDDDIDAMLDQMLDL